MDAVPRRPQNQPPLPKPPAPKPKLLHKPPPNLQQAPRNYRVMQDPTLHGPSAQKHYAYFSLQVI